MCAHVPACAASRSFRRTDVDKLVPKCNLTLFLFAPFFVILFLLLRPAEIRPTTPSPSPPLSLVRLRRCRSLLRITYVSFGDCAARYLRGCVCCCTFGACDYVSPRSARYNNRDWIILYVYYVVYEFTISESDILYILIYFDKTNQSISVHYISINTNIRSYYNKAGGDSKPFVFTMAAIANNIIMSILTIIFIVA